MPALSAKHRVALVTRFSRLPASSTAHHLVREVHVLSEAEALAGCNVSGIAEEVEEPTAED